ncbi:putative isopentenyltransferase [Heterostelium album PN500]|uniref:tRNA dimethylallyltransferase n=1 Tax=Heterostelium pallidum (strain ATCC 26659 / Pp 5 / PN500) TaxID=670386 RepID=D3BGL7_HETP5|nr:putative isopentenyltransferase [Heterostelium album PN500]EFA79251.1 putative isopentenyltransferase [Heterostelium album PN500]|eukprot:XP_020431372.1 putative isopentenyltransferase [Heterostelium album PN500]
MVVWILEESMWWLPPFVTTKQMMYYLRGSNFMLKQSCSGINNVISSKLFINNSKSTFGIGYSSSTSSTLPPPPPHQFLNNIVNDKVNVFVNSGGSNGSSGNNSYRSKMGTSSSSSSTLLSNSISSMTDSSSMELKKKVMIISGATGIGKSAMALQLAKNLGGEIVCADSVQIYKHLNIGSNKGRIDEVPHHLFDILELNDDFNVKQYHELAMNAINDILARGKIPIVVGGCGFYIDSLINGINDYPIHIEEERNTLAMIEERLRAENNWYRVATILKDIDPESATTINRNDYKRLAKSFYIYSQTGLKYSDFKKQRREVNDSYDFRSFYLTTRRDSLMHILNHRCELMIQNGLIKEVVEVLLNGLSPHSQVSRSIGYKQCINILLTPMNATGNLVQEESVYKMACTASTAERGSQVYTTVGGCSVAGGVD